MHGPGMAPNGAEWMLSQNEQDQERPQRTVSPTNEAGKASGAIGDGSLKRLAFGTTVMEFGGDRGASGAAKAPKDAIAHPADSRLCERARARLVALAQEDGGSAPVPCPARAAPVPAGRPLRPSRAVQAHAQGPEKAQGMHRAPSQGARTGGAPAQRTTCTAISAASPRAACATGWWRRSRWCCGCCTRSRKVGAGSAPRTGPRRIASPGARPASAPSPAAGPAWRRRCTRASWSARAAFPATRMTAMRSEPRWSRSRFSPAKGRDWPWPTAAIAATRSLPHGC